MAAVGYYGAENIQNMVPRSLPKIVKPKMYQSKHRLVLNSKSLVFSTQKWDTKSRRINQGLELVEIIRDKDSLHLWYNIKLISQMQHTTSILKYRIQSLLLIRNV